MDNLYEFLDTNYDSIDPILINKIRETNFIRRNDSRDMIIKYIITILLLIN